VRKIISLFQRNYDGDRLVRDEVVPGAEWVIAGQGTATVKIDGTSCLVRNGQLFKRYDAKRGRTPPEGWEPCEPEPNEHTGHWPGWLPVGNGPEDQWHREAWDIMQSDLCGAPVPDGTYELIGPKVQANPYHMRLHELTRHGAIVPEHLNFPEPPRDFAGLQRWLSEHEVEGIVWHHPDGRMCKLKRRDLGLPWPARQRSA
jgi:hypothetical protein